MITAVFGFLIAINASITKLFPKLVGALTAISFPSSNSFNSLDYSLCNVIFSVSPVSTLKAS